MELRPSSTNIGYRGPALSFVTVGQDLDKPARKSPVRSESTENQQKAQHLEVMKSFPLIWDFERNKKQRELQNSLDKGQKTDDEI